MLTEIRDSIIHTEVPVEGIEDVVEVVDGELGCDDLVDIFTNLVNDLKGDINDRIDGLDMINDFIVEEEEGEQEEEEGEQEDENPNFSSELKAECDDSISLFDQYRVKFDNIEADFLHFVDGTRDSISKKTAQFFIDQVSRNKQELLTEIQNSITRTEVPVEGIDDIAEVVIGELGCDDWVDIFTDNVNDIKGDINNRIKIALGVPPSTS